MEPLMLSKIHDLTRVINKDIQVYPGDPKPEFRPTATIKDDNVNITRITLGSHTGTHVDAPRHFLQEGNGIDKDCLEKFVGDAVVVDGSAKKSLAGRDLASSDIRANDILLIFTGTGHHRTDFTYLETSAAEWIVEHRLKCVGIDTPSVEQYGRKDAPVHKMLLAHNIGIVENLDNLRQFISKRLFFVCLPLPLEGIDGSPARAIALDLN
jgi:kynurenine formamidase